MINGLTFVISDSMVIYSFSLLRLSNSIKKIKKIDF